MTKSCFLVISFFKFPIVFAGVILTTFHALENLGCYRNIPSQHVFETDGVASVAICASKCTSNVSCLGILYSPEDNVCIGCSVLITVNDSNTYSFMSLESQGMFNDINELVSVCLFLLFFLFVICLFFHIPFGNANH
jgi:hypothetical protein